MKRKKYQKTLYRKKQKKRGHIPGNKGFKFGLVIALVLLVVLPLLVGIPPPTLTAAESFLLLDRVDVDVELTPGAFVVCCGPEADADRDDDEEEDPNRPDPPGELLIPKRPRFIILAGVTGTRG